MPVTIGALRETVPGETRVSVVPEVAEKLSLAGARVLGCKLCRLCFARLVAAPGQ